MWSAVGSAKELETLHAPCVELVRVCDSVETTDPQARLGPIPQPKDAIEQISFLFLPLVVSKRRHDRSGSACPTSFLVGSRQALGKIRRRTVLGCRRGRLSGCGESDAQPTKQLFLAHTSPTVKENRGRSHSVQLWSALHDVRRGETGSSLSLAQADGGSGVAGHGHGGQSGQKGPV